MELLADTRHSRAVLVGTSRYRSLPQLPAVAGGVRDLAAALTDPDLWGLSEAHCRTLVDPTGTDAVLDVVRGVAAEATDLFILYLAGHGFVDPDTDELYLALPTTEPDRPWTALPYTWLRRAMQHHTVRARRKLVLLDCCYSGTALGGSLAAPSRIGDRVAISGACVLTATAETRTALAPRGEVHTAFTGELLATLTRGVPGGPAVLDVETIYHDLHTKLGARNRPLPQMRSRNAGHRIPLTRNRATTATTPRPLPPTPARRRWPVALVAAAALITGADTGPGSVEPPVVKAVLACDNPEPRPSPTSVDTDVTTAISQVRSQLGNRDELVIGTMFGRPGHAERCADGGVRGFDIAIGEIIAADLGFPPDKVTWIDLAAPERLAAILEGRVDLVVGSMAITAERKQRIAFAGPYERSAQTLLVPAGNTTINRLEDLRSAGRTACAPAGSTSINRLTDSLPDPAQVIAAESIGECIALLLQGRVNAVTGDRSLLLGYDRALAGRTRLVNDSFDDVSYGIAMPLRQPDLHTAVRDILARSYQDGRYGRAWKDSLGRLVPEVDSGPQLTE